jgi:zinc/manganese transport system substrate-binding protein
LKKILFRYKIYLVKKRGESVKNFNLKKFTFILIGLNLIFFIVLTFYPKLQMVNNVSAEERDAYLNIMTTNKLTYSMARGLVKDKHYVDYMFKNNDDMLNYKYTQDSIDNISNMDLFIYSGAQAEPWVNNFINKLKKDKIGIINGSRGIKLINYNKPQIYNDYEVKTNSYYYLSPDNFKISLYNIKCAIQEKDPKNRDYYEQNYNLMIEDLNDYLDNLYNELGNLKGKSIYTIGENLDYFLRYLSIDYSKLTPEEMDKKIEGIEKIKQEEEKIKQEENKNIILFSEVNMYNKYNSKLDELGYRAFLVNVPDSVESYKNYLINMTDFIKSVSDNPKEEITKK